jgi:PilZ domain
VLGPERRRSKRLSLDVPLVVRGEAEDTRVFQEGTLTLNVSAHGALVVLGTKVTVGQKLELMNLKNWLEREGAVTHVGPHFTGFTRVGIEFAQPAPEFWSISERPQDWGLSSPHSFEPQ